MIYSGAIHWGYVSLKLAISSSTAGRVRTTDDGVFFLNDGDVPVVELDSSGDVFAASV